MPFDGNEQEFTFAACQLLRLREAFLRAGPAKWAKKSFATKRGKHCVLGRLLKVHGFYASEFEYLYTTLGMPVLRLAQCVPYSDPDKPLSWPDTIELITNWQDMDERAFPDVVALINRAIELEVGHAV